MAEQQVGVCETKCYYMQTNIWLLTELSLCNLVNWLERNKLASLGATLVRNYDPLTYLLTH